MGACTGLTLKIITPGPVVATASVIACAQGSSSTSTAPSVQVSLTATVEGLGPAFRLCLALCNEGSIMVRDTQVGRELQ